MTSTRDIEEFLEALRGIMDERGLNIWPTTKNQEFLVESGFTNDDIEEIVRTLRPDHYKGGPKDDDKSHRANGEVWIFGREYEGFELYIKLKRIKGSEPIAECLSAHEAEFSMRKPNRRHR